jgi:hypothetical protein
MICHEFKGGIGTASRRLNSAQGGWTVGAIVQANHGIRGELRVDGYPVGRYMEQVDSPFLRPRCRIRAWVRSWSAWPPMHRCCRTSAHAWPSAPASVGPYRWWQRRPQR